jgi:hypothetical protein
MIIFYNMERYLLLSRPPVGTIEWLCRTLPWLVYLKYCVPCHVGCRWPLSCLSKPPIFFILFVLLFLHFFTITLAVPVYRNRHYWQPIDIHFTRSYNLTDLQQQNLLSLSVSSDSALRHRLLNGNIYYINIFLFCF